MEKFFNKVGKVDIIIDDGGHTNKQQIITLNETVPFIKYGGMLVIEDVHSSYMTKFSNPSEYSFINYCKKLIDQLNHKSNLINFKKINKFQKKIFSIEFFQSMVVLNVGNDTKIDSKEVSNNGKSDNSKDFRYFNNLKLLDRIFIKLSYLQTKKFKTIYFLKLNRYLTYKLSFFADKIIKKIFKKN